MNNKVAKHTTQKFSHLTLDASMGKRFRQVLQVTVIAAVSLATIALPDSTYAAGRVFYDGFEAGNTNQWIAGSDAGAVGKCDVVTSALDGRTGPLAGTYMARCNWDGTEGVWGHSHQQMNVSWPMSNEALIRFHVRVDNDIDAKPGSKLFRWNDFNNMGAIQFEMGSQATLYTRCHDDDGTQLGTTNWGNGAAFLDGKWHKIELYIKKNNGGAIKIWVDGSLAWQALNINTDDPTWNVFHLMSNWSLNTGWEHDANNHVYWDEFEVYSDSGSDAVGSMADATITVGNSITLSPPTSLQLIE